MSYPFKYVQFSNLQIIKCMGHDLHEIVVYKIKDQCPQMIGLVYFYIQKGRNVVCVYLIFTDERNLF